MYYGWANLVVAAFAMVATLPGRTQGLGLVTESLMADLRLDRVTFATINLCASTYYLALVISTLVGLAANFGGGWQMLTVFASAVGPLLLAQTLQRTGSYDAIFYGLAAAVVALGIGSWCVSLPYRQHRTATSTLSGFVGEAS